MSRFDFSSIGDIISEMFDSDYIDIKRDINGKLLEVYSNVSCHISYNSTDNPDPNSVDLKPIIQSINIHVPTWVDIRNNDYIIAKKIDSEGKILATYNGRCGNPIVSQSRKKVTMNMQGTDIEEPTPVPPIIENSSVITISFNYDNTSIKDKLTSNVEIGSQFVFNPINIEGYEVSKCYINGIESDVNIDFIVENKQYEIQYEYIESSEPDGFRFLVKGLYTTNEGTLKNGYHLYKKVYLNSIIKNENQYTIVVDNTPIIHEDSGVKLEIKDGVKLVLTPQKIFVIVDEITSQNGKITFIASEFVPTDEELNAYMTGWYDEF